MFSVVSLAVALLMLDEGFSATIYLCPALKKSVGYGRNLEAFPLTEEELKEVRFENGEMVVTKAVAEKWLVIAVQDIIKKIHNEPYYKGGEVRQAVIVNMIYNMGLPKFLTFKKFIQAMIDEDWELAAKELLTGSGSNGKSKYYEQVGKRAERNAEMIRTGEHF